MSEQHTTRIVRHNDRCFEARCSCGWRQKTSSPEAADALAVGHRGYSPDAKVIIAPIREHSTWVTRHDRGSCNTARHAEDGDCGTRYEAHCSCGFGQGAICHEHAVAIGRGHCANPTAQCITWEPGPPLTADTITDRDLRDLFERHCECRDLDGVDVRRAENDHAAIHDCDTGILHDVQIALGIIRFDDIGRVQAIREARGRCAKVINDARKER